MNTTNFPGRVERRKQDAKNRNKAWVDAPAYDPSITPRMRRRASCVSL